MQTILYFSNYKTVENVLWWLWTSVCDLPAAPSLCGCKGLCPSIHTSRLLTWERRDWMPTSSHLQGLSQAFLSLVVSQPVRILSSKFSNYIVFFTNSVPSTRSSNHREKFESHTGKRIPFKTRSSFHRNRGDFFGHRSLKTTCQKGNASRVRKNVSESSKWNINRFSFLKPQCLLTSFDLLQMKAVRCDFWGLTDP